MFKYKNKTFYVTRMESGEITLKNKKSTFNLGDVVEFKIYNENGLDENPLFVKSFEVTESNSNALVLEFLSADTNFAEPANEILTFWYEIILNGDKTIFGFDDNKAKIFYIYPRGIDKK